MRISFFFFSQKLRITFECGLNSSAGCFRVNSVFQISFFASMRLFWFHNCDNFPSFVVIIRFCLPSASNGIDLQCIYDTHHGKLQHCSKRIHCVFVYLPVSVVVAAHCHQYNTVHTVPTTDKRDHELVVESVWSICLICNCTLP